MTRVVPKLQGRPMTSSIEMHHAIMKNGIYLPHYLLTKLTIVNNNNKHTQQKSALQF